MHIAATLYISIGLAYALLTFYKVRRFTARWHLLTNMLPQQPTIKPMRHL